jgi:putative acetyltransferase
MREHSPPGSVHALDLDRLRDPAVTFWTVWSGPELAGCGALRELSPSEGELKSMRTAPAFLRRGVAALLLETIFTAARARGYARVSLETGTGPAFEAAHAPHARHGFAPRGPFGDYPADPPDPFSRFLTRVP